METAYTPVPYECREHIAEEIAKARSGKIFFFNDQGQVDSWEGRILTLEDRPQSGMFITMAPEKLIRIDRIITVFGKPGAAYDEYDSFANQCLSCTGGYDL